MAKRQEISENEYYVLNSLAREPLYGYAIRDEVEQMTGGKKRLSLATLYDTLHRLFQDKLIERQEDKQVEGRLRRTYRITGAGQQALLERYRTMELLRSIRQRPIAEGEV
jgi:PadR family transcriptional regulator, regulatory protein PadR